VCCWQQVGESLTQSFREQYVAAIFSQEVGWFDTQGAANLATNVSELTGKVVRKN
jgi:hypothetical protein